MNLEAFEDRVSGLGLLRLGILEDAGVGVHGLFRSEAALGAVEAGAVRVGAVDPEMGTVRSSHARGADGLLKRRESVLQPSLADLLETTVLEAVHVLTDDRVFRIP